MHLKNIGAILPSLLLALSFAVTPVAAASGVTLEWDPNTEPNVAGYKVLYGFSCRNYRYTVDAGNSTRLTITGLQPGTTYHFAVMAYGVEGEQSDYSDEVIYTPEAAPVAASASRGDLPGGVARTPAGAPVQTHARPSDLPDNAARSPAAASASGCSYVLWPAGTAFSASGGTGTVIVSTAAGCSWTASTSASWLAIASKSSGKGPGVVRYTVSSVKEGVSRAATVTVAGKTFIVNQTARYRIGGK